MAFEVVVSVTEQRSVGCAPEQVFALLQDVPRSISLAGGDGIVRRWSFP